jgi:putative transposase
MREKGESLKSACETLRTSRSGQYRKPTKRSNSARNQVLLEKLKELRLAHPFWGYRRMTAWLRYREGLTVNRKRIQRLMRENGLLVETVRHKALRTSPRGKPKATRPNQYWGIDMTKFLLGPLGWCYLVVVLDWYTKEIVGWNLSLRAKTSEWKEALARALCEKFPWGVRDQGLNLVSDNGAQPTSVAFMKDTAELGINQIFCSYDNPRGNAETERVIRTIKEEVLRLNDFGSFEEAGATIGAWIGEDYNRLYVHSALGYRSPEEFRQQWIHAQEAVLGGC